MPRYLTLLPVLLLAACGGGEGTDTPVDAGVDAKSLTSFPSELAVASPFDFVESAQVPLSRVGRSAASAGSSRYVWATARIDAILNGTTPLLDLFTPQMFYRTGTNAPCYGPTLLYQDHPDGTPASGQLPGGDLLLWLEQDPDSGHACAAAQMNSRLSGVREQSMSALMAL